MNHNTKKTALILISISLSAILISIIHTIYNIGSLSDITNMQYPTIIIDGVAPRNVVGVAIDKNLKVLMVEPNSAAEQAELEVGDVILEINGQSVKDIDSVKKEISDVVIVLPTDSPESVKLPQEIKDATAAAYIKSNLVSKNMGKIVISVMKSKQIKLTIDIDKKPQGAIVNVTPTPVSSDGLYF